MRSNQFGSSLPLLAISVLVAFVSPSFHCSCDHRYRIVSAVGEALFHVFGIFIIRRLRLLLLIPQVSLPHPRSLRLPSKKDALILNTCCLARPDVSVYHIAELVLDDVQLFVL